MQSSSMPPKVPVAFAEAGLKNTIPIESQVAVKPGAASLRTGFPPLTMTPLEAGGVAPFGQDVNGILNLISGQAMWFGAGGPVYFDAAFASAIGGYPRGALLASATAFGTYWLSTVDNNATNPDAGGAGWMVQSISGSASDLIARINELRAIRDADVNNLNNYNAGQDGRLLNLEARTGGRLIAVASYGTGGVYTHTYNPATSFLIVEAVGAGGAGGGAAVPGANQASVGSGAGSGGYVMAIVYNRPGRVGATSKITVGVAGQPTFGGAGGSGGTSSIDGIVAASGGVGGGSLNGTALGCGNQGGGGTFATGDTSFVNAITNAGGNSGESGIILAPNYCFGGAGAPGPWGGGGIAVGQFSGGSPATGFGAGGGGACLLAGQGPAGGALGGIGGTGLVTIREYT